MPVLKWLVRIIGKNPTLLSQLCRALPFAPGPVSKYVILSGIHTGNLSFGGADLGVRLGLGTHTQVHLYKDGIFLFL